MNTNNQETTTILHSTYENPEMNSISQDNNVDIELVNSLENIVQIQPHKNARKKHKKQHRVSYADEMTMTGLNQPPLNPDAQNEISTETLAIEKATKILRHQSISKEPQYMDMHSEHHDEAHSIEHNDVAIIEYAAEHLLPLPLACGPLSDIIHDLSSYVQLALQETHAEPENNLTVDESAAIRLYTFEWEPPHRSLYSMLNHTLKYRPREELKPYFKYLKLFLTALAKLPCLPQLTVWRGVTKDLSSEFAPGTEVTWWSFSSCTTSLVVLKNSMYLGDLGARTLFSVEAINGRTIRDHSHFVTEDEVLLLPGTRMIVQSQLSPAPDLYIIHLKQVIPEETLLELPFEGTII